MLSASLPADALDAFEELFLYETVGVATYGSMESSPSGPESGGSASNVVGQCRYASPPRGATRPADEPPVTRRLTRKTTWPSTLTGASKRVEHSLATAATGCSHASPSVPAELGSSDTARLQAALPRSHSAEVDADAEVAAAPVPDVALTLGYHDSFDIMDDNVEAALHNAENTCYLNALLHVLARVPAVRLWFQQHLEIWGENHSGLQCPLCLIAADVNQLCMHFDPTPFVPAIVAARALWSGGIFANRRMHDVMEALNLLFNSLNTIDERAALHINPECFLGEMGDTSHHF